MNLSLAIVTHNRPELLCNCLKSIAQNIKNLKPESKLIITAIDIAINGNDSCNYENIIDQITDDSSIHFKEKIAFKKYDKQSPAAIRNQLVTLQTSEYVLFLDDDIILNNDYLLNLEKLLTETPNIDVIGGPDGLYPETSSFEKAFSLALQSPFTTFNTRKRHHLSQEENGNESNLTLCNLLVRREIIQKYRFNEELFRNEENLLLNQIAHFHIRRSHLLGVYHKRREGLRAFIPSFFSGYYRMKMLSFSLDNIKFRYYLPVLALLLVLLSLFTFPFLFVSLVFLYFLINILSSLFICIKNRSHALTFTVSYAQFMILFHYALGQLAYLIGLKFHE